MIFYKLVFMIEYSVSFKVRQKLQGKSSMVNLWEVDEALDDPGKSEATIKRNRKLKETTKRYVGETESGRLLQVFIIFKESGAWLMSAYDASKTLRNLYNKGK